MCLFLIVLVNSLSIFLPVISRYIPFRVGKEKVQIFYMNPLFFPNQSNKGKVGLNRVKKIIKYGKIPTVKSPVLEDVPDSWYFNEKGAEKVWDNLEKSKDSNGKVPHSNRGDQLDDNDGKKNAFDKIDESTSKIKLMIKSLELSDQDFLIKLMDLLDSDSGSENMDQQSILMEARLKLSSIINEHVLNADAQAHLLDQLKYWFVDVQGDKKVDFDIDMQNLKDDDDFDPTHLANIINSAFEKSEMCSEKAGSIHKAIIDQFSRQLRDLRNALEKKDREILFLRQQIDKYQKGSRRRREKNLRLQANAEDAQRVLEGAQRKIIEQENKITDLQQILSGRKDSPEKDSRITSFNNAIQETELNQTGSGKEIDLLTKIHVLQEQIHNLKKENSDFNQEIKDLKVAKIDQERNYVSLERSKKMVEECVRNLNERYSLMETNYKKQLEEAQSKATVTLDNQMDSQIVADIKAQYESKITQIKEHYSKQQHQLLQNAEKRHKAQINDMLKALENADQSAALAEVIKQRDYQTKIEDDRHQKEMQDMKNVHMEKIKSLTNQYETKLKDAFKQQDMLKKSMQQNIEQALATQKLQLDNEYRNGITDIEYDNAQKMLNLKKKLEQKIESLETFNRKLVHERNLLRDVIDEEKIAVDIPMAEDEIEEEDEEEDIDIIKKLKEEKEQLEQKINQIKDEYSSLMEQQKESYEKSMKWEIDKVKEDLARQFDSQMAEFRQNMVSGLVDIREKLENGEGLDVIDRFIESLLNNVVKTSAVSGDIVNREPMIKLSEANEKLKSLNDKVIEVQSENEFLKKTLSKLTGNKDLEDSKGNDLIKSMRSVVSEEAEKINDYLIEIENLNKENNSLKETVNANQSQLDSLNENNKQLSDEYTELQNKLQDADKNIELLKHKIEELTKEINEKSTQKSEFKGEISMPMQPPSNIAVDDADKNHTQISLSLSNKNIVESSNRFESECEETPIPQESDQQKMSISQYKSEDSIKMAMNGHQRLCLSNEMFASALKDDQGAVKGDIVNSVVIHIGNNPIKIDEADKKLSKSFSKPNKNRVSFQNGVVKPPRRIHVKRKEEPPEGHEGENTSILAAKPNKFENGYNGTSLDGASNPFSRPLDDLLNSPNEETVSRDLVKPFDHKEVSDHLSKMSQSDSNHEEDEEFKPGKLLPSNSLTFDQIQSGSNTSSMKSIDMNSAGNSPINGVRQVQSGLPPSNPSSLPASGENSRNGSPFSNGGSRGLVSSNSITMEDMLKFSIGVNTSQRNSRNSTPQDAQRRKLDLFLNKPPELKRSEISYFFIHPDQSNLSTMERLKMQIEAKEKEKKEKEQKKVEKDLKAEYHISSLELSNADYFVQCVPLTDDLESPTNNKANNNLAIAENYPEEIEKLKSEADLIKNTYKELSDITKDLQDKHDEIVKFLTSQLDTAIKLAKGDGDHPEALIEKMQEQSVYLTSALREKENLASQFNHQQLLLKEQGQKLVILENDCASKDKEIDDLSSKLKALVLKVKESEEVVSNYENMQSAYKSNEESMKAQVESLENKVNEIQKSKHDTDQENENLKLEIEKLHNEFAINSKKSEVDMAMVSPFIIFTSEANPNLGFALQPVERNSSRNSEEVSSRGQNENLKNQGKSSLSGRHDNVDEHDMFRVSIYHGGPANKAKSPVESKNDQNTKKEEEKLKSLQNDSQNKPKNDQKEKSDIDNEKFDTYKPQVQDDDIMYVTPIATLPTSNKQKTVNSSRSSQSNVESSRSNLSDHVKIPLSPIELTVSGKLRAISAHLHDSQKAQYLTKRLQALETKYVARTEENVRLKAELHDLRQELFGAQNSYAKVLRDLKKLEASKQSVDNKVSSSVALITSLSTENEALKRLLAKYRHLSHKVSRDMEQAARYSELKDISMVNEMQNRALMHEIQTSMGTSKLKDIAARRALALAKWEGRRRYLQQKEREKLLAVLQAMNLANPDLAKQEKAVPTINSQRHKFKKQPPKKNKGIILTPDAITERREVQSFGMRIINYNIPPQKEKVAYNIRTVNDKNNEADMPTPDQALKTANFNQKVPRKLKIGVVGNPIQTD